MYSPLRFSPSRSRRWHKWAGGGFGGGARAGVVRGAGAGAALGPVGDGAREPRGAGGGGRRAGTRRR